jgi:hypothetical protein
MTKEQADSFCSINRQTNSFIENSIEAGILLGVNVAALTTPPSKSE